MLQGTRPVDAIDRQLQCSYIYDDSNGRFDSGEGRTNEKITVRQFGGGTYHMNTVSDGFYSHRQPVDYFFFKKSKKRKL